MWRSDYAYRLLKIEIREDKKHNKVSQKQYEKFMDLLKVGDPKWVERTDVMFVANFVVIVMK